MYTVRNMSWQELTERKKKIIAAIEKGDKSLRAIGRDFGVSAETVRRIGISEGVRSYKVRRVEAHEINTVLVLRNEGLSISSIAASMGRSYSSVRKHLIKAGVITGKRPNKVAP